MAMSRIALAINTIAERVQTRFPGVPILISNIGAVLAVHTRPAALGLMTYRP
jgi:hypothetical protein